MKHLYKPLYRPAGFAGLPTGWEYAEAPHDLPQVAMRFGIPMSRHTHGVIAYDHKLTQDEVKRHELEYLGPQ
jgi:hypothetical protein